MAEELERDYAKRFTDNVRAERDRALELWKRYRHDVCAGVDGLVSWERVREEVNDLLGNDPLLDRINALLCAKPEEEKP